ncbi:hypothetical protein ADIS_0851 [Lunatimonas lonarensis]|uniref:Uncharacterized protein n=1 Tax=Lunatimonas lonarensis TaxID=1232681 RepID=R7ZX77_9BACT|nr:hypothetical protein ADIS_0851 [Lunatimonas lonarensis]
MVDPLLKFYPVPKGQRDDGESDHRSDRYKGLGRLLNLDVTVKDKKSQDYQRMNQTGNKKGNLFCHASVMVFSRSLIVPIDDGKILGISPLAGLGFI